MLHCGYFVSLGVVVLFYDCCLFGLFERAGRLLTLGFVVVVILWILITFEFCGSALIVL